MKYLKLISLLLTCNLLAAITLPVETQKSYVTETVAYPVDDAIVLTWSTIGESGVYYIERSMNGLAWQKIGRTTQNGFTDLSQPKGKIYYRIIHSYEKESTDTTVISLTLYYSEVEVWSIVDGDLEFNYPQPSTGEVWVKNEDGETVQRFNFVDLESFVLTMDFPPGEYTFDIYESKNFHSFKYTQP